MGLLAGLLDALYPRRCPFCGTLTGREGPCENCERELTLIALPRCHLCGCAADECSCEPPRPEYNAVVAPFYYENAVKRGIYRLKFRGAKRAAEPFSAYMADCYEREFAGLGLDFAVAVPLTKRGRRLRGYNQAQQLARGLCRRIGLPFAEGVLVKLKDNPPQHRVKRRERVSNVYGVFAVSPKAQVEGKNILLVDDVKTTGATLSECAKMLKIAGAKSVFCVTLAVTGLKRRRNSAENQTSSCQMRQTVTK
ncbi:ComF family protein [Feifania hominis]|uniref:ComF family protein n=1 Tax=Feifania hominis TaxID=2763660 RepID=A0A926DCA8_9FIRM|nr:ComF family protein [Feifania hominis]MBC8535468.1 ComF family protein [Feifania hominis]